MPQAKKYALCLIRELYSRYGVKDDAGETEFTKRINSTYSKVSDTNRIIIK